MGHKLSEWKEVPKKEHTSSIRPPEFLGSNHPSSTDGGIGEGNERSTASSSSSISSADNETFSTAVDVAEK
jgi:hypothetical protein